MADGAAGGGKLDPKKLAWLRDALQLDPSAVSSLSSGTDDEQSADPATANGDDRDSNAPANDPDPSGGSADNGDGGSADAPADRKGSLSSPVDISGPTIVNSGDSGWDVVVAGQPKSIRTSPLACALPKGLSAKDLMFVDGRNAMHTFEEPNAFKYDIVLGAHVGSYNGKGSFLYDIGIYASGEVPTNGFGVDIRAEFLDPEYEGSKDDPVAFISFTLTAKITFNGEPAGTFNSGGVASAKDGITAIKDQWSGALTVKIMKADCKLVHGRVPGPKNHLMCGTHGHIIDTDTKIIIADNLDEYKQRYPRGGK